MSKSTLVSTAQNLKSSIVRAQTDGMVIKAYLNTIRSQPDIVSDFAPGLPATQSQARKNATFWDKTVWPGATQNVTDLFSFSTAWGNYRFLLEGYAQTIASTTASQAQKDEARNNLDQLLGQIYGDINAKYENTETTVANLQRFDDTITETNAEFDKNLKALQDKFAGKSGVIAQLNGEIDTLQDGLGKDIAVIVGGSITTLTGIGLIIVGAACEFESAGTSTGIIVTGVGTTVAGIGAIIGASVDLNNKIQNIADLISEKTEDEALYTAVKVAISQVTGLDEKCAAAKLSANDLMTHWADLKKEIETLRNDIKSVNPGDFGIQARIAEASADFAEIKKTCENIQAAFSGGNPPTTTKVVNEKNFPVKAAA